MSERRLKISVFVLLIILIADARQSLQAQSSIFNVPTTDVLPPQKVYVEADYIAHPAPYEREGFQFFGPSVIYGLRKNVEVGLNAYYTLSSEPDAAEIQPNAKWQFYSDERKGFAAAAGGILFIPLKNRETTNTKALLYVTLSQQIKGRFGPRLTTGAYSFVGRMEEGENRSGLLLGYEQPLLKRLSFVADWYSGNNSFGYAAGALGITFPKETYLYAGYSFGNQGRGNNWLGIFFGRTF
ncbi:MAG TPA: hypothetical protein VM095_11345 [Pyrinomonadaceae bacterium]|nr:hypothetical protein [Pyrinomonadaceae bacterium]